MRSRPGSARTILLFYTISARPSKQPLMVRTFLKVYGANLQFLFLQEQLKEIIIILGTVVFGGSNRQQPSGPPRELSLLS